MENSLPKFIWKTAVNMVDGGDGNSTHNDQVLLHSLKHL